MAAIVLAMIIILGVAGTTLALVLMGMEGRGKRHAPRFAHRLARAAQHLNGDGRPPRRLTRLLS
ncbi:MAG: hypothetical protein ACLGIF_05710 [Actinomycetes bacterium]